MPSKEKIGREALRVTVAKIVAQALTLILAMLMSRFLSLEEYGTYSQIVLVITMLTSLLMLGLPNSMNYFMGRADNEIQKREFLSVYYSLSTLLGLFIGVILCCATSLLISYFHNPAIGTLGAFLLLYPLGRIITYSAENLFVVFHRTNSLLYYRLLYSGSLIASITISHFMKVSFRAYMLLLMAVTLFFSFVVYYSAYSFSGGLRLSFSISKIRSILAFSIPLGLATAVGTINIELDKFMIGKFVNTTTLAIYTNASKEMPVAIVASAFTAVMLPKFAKYLKDNKRDQVVFMWGSATKISFLFICFLGIGMFVFAPDCLRVLYSEKYVPGMNIFRVYCLVLLLRTTYFGIVLNSSGKSKLIFYSALAALGLNCVLNFLLYQLLGIIGPAIATLISQVVINGFQLFYSCKLLNISMTKIFPWKDLMTILLVNVVVGIVFLLLKQILPLDCFCGTAAESIILAIIWGVCDIVLFRNVGIREWKRFNSF